MKLSRLYFIPKHKPLISIDSEHLITFSKGIIYKVNIQNNTKTKIISLPLPIIKKIICKLRLFSRLFRLEPRISIMLSESLLLISFNGKMYIIDLIQKTINIDFIFRNDMKNPLYITEIKNNNTLEQVIFGEYCSNSKRSEVNVYARGVEKADTWRNVYTFPKNSIVHIHNIVHDEKNNIFYILTGDLDNESIIWYTKDDFSTVNILIGGEQLYRSCVAFLQTDKLIAITDSPNIYNKGIIIDTKKNSLDTILSEVNGPAIYSLNDHGNFFFSTSVEPRYKKSFSYIVSFKKSKFIKENSTVLYYIDSSGKIKEILRLKKDLLPMPLFQFATIQFCKSTKEDLLIIYPVATTKYEGGTLIYEISKA